MDYFGSNQTRLCVVMETKQSAKQTNASHLYFETVSQFKPGRQLQLQKLPPATIRMPLLNINTEATSTTQCKDAVCSKFLSLNCFWNLASDPCYCMILWPKWDGTVHCGVWMPGPTLQEWSTLGTMRLCWSLSTYIGCSLILYSSQHQCVVLVSWTWGLAVSLHVSWHQVLNYSNLQHCLVLLPVLGCATAILTQWSSLLWENFFHILCASKIAILHERTHNIHHGSK